MKFPEQFYSGLTDDVDKRVAAHNNGMSQHTAKFKPWKLNSFVAFANEKKAFEFEKYLKSGSGRAFSTKHFRD